MAGKWWVCVLVGVAAMAGPASAERFHTTDQDKDHSISLPELLRAIQFYNYGSFHCDAAGEDGFKVGVGDEGCAGYDADYKPRDFKLSLSELLRVIQFYNGSGYFECADGEDGFCLLPAGNRPNIVVILMDTTREDRLGGSRNSIPIMPNMAALAATGTRFTKAWSSSGWTMPGLAGLFTGKYSERFREISQPDGVNTVVRFPLPDSEETMAELLARYGYDPWMVQTNGNGQAVYGFAQGVPDAQFLFTEFPPAAMVNSAVLANKDNWKEPFFVYAQYVDPHAQYTPPVEYANVFGTQPKLTGTDAVYLDPGYWSTYYADVLSGYFLGTQRKYVLTANGVNVMQYRYDAETRYMDDELGTLVSTIKAQYPNTIFAMVADHGEALLDRDISGHGHQLFEEMVNVPFFMSGPGIPAQVIDRRCSTISLLPTLARAVSISPEPQWEGEDLLHAGPAHPEYAYTMNYYQNANVEASCVVDGNLKLMYDTHLGISPRLFDLSADPGELHDLAGSRPSDVATLSGLLSAHHTAVTK